MSRILLLADVHLGFSDPAVSNAERRNSRKEDFHLAFAKAIDFASDALNKIDAVVINGNLFHSHLPDQQTMEFAGEQLRKLVSKDILVLIIPGRFDSLAYPGNIYDLEEFWGVRIIKSKTLTLIDNIAEILPEFYAVSDYGNYPGLTGLPVSASANGRPKIAFIPSDILEIISGDEKEIQTIKKAGFDCICTGNSTNYQAVKLGDVDILTPGSLVNFSIEDASDRFLTILEIIENKVLIHQENMQFDPMQFSDEIIDLEQEKLIDEAELAAFLRDRFGSPNCIARLKLTGTVNFAFDPVQLSRRLQPDFFSLEIIDETDFLNSMRVKSLEDEKSALGEVIKAVISGPQPDSVKNVALKLIMSRL